MNSRSICPSGRVHPPCGLCREVFVEEQTADEGRDGRECRARRLRKRRRDLLSVGIRLYEMKPSAVTVEAEHRQRGIGSSSASLHAGTTALDGTQLFVGSFNFDECSAFLNTGRDC